MPRHTRESKAGASAPALAPSPRVERIVAIHEFSDGSFDVTGTRLGRNRDPDADLHERDTTQDAAVAAAVRWLEERGR